MSNFNHWAPEKLENAIQKEDWTSAQKMLQAALKQSPKDHWLLTQLAMAFYEGKDYQTAYKWSAKAVGEMPDCPLVVWNHACILDMLNRTDEAIESWKRLLRRGVEGLAKSECSEGKLWAESMVNDVRYRLGLAYEDRGDFQRAKELLTEHLNGRRPGLFSLYRKSEVEAALRELDKQAATTSASVA